MHLSTLLPLALGASAMLLPPPVDNTDAEFWDAASPIMVQSDSKTISLPCTGCPVAIGNEDGHPTEWSEGARTELQMEFTVKDNELCLNGRPFYPPTSENAGTPLFVKQVYAEDENNNVNDIYNGSIMISIGVDVHEKMEIASVRLADLHEGENPVSKLPMRRISFEVLGLADKVLHVDTVELLVSESDDELTLFGINTTPYTRHSTPEGDACTTIFCRVRASIKAKLAAFRAGAAAKFGSFKNGCMRKMSQLGHKMNMSAPHPHHGHHANGMPKLKGGVPKYSGDATLAPGGHNHPHGPWGKHGDKMHHHHHGGHRVIRMIGRFFRHVVLPILIGVAAGMLVSAVGMLIGQAVVYLMFRRRNNGYRSVDQVESATDAERESFEELPKYEEAPEYEESVQFVDEKQQVEEEHK